MAVTISKSFLTKTYRHFLSMSANKLTVLKEIGQIANQRFTSLSYPKHRLGLICGGRGNLGDDAMLEAAERLFPNARLLPYIYPKQEGRFELIGLSGIRYFDSVILGGGTLISSTWFDMVRTALQQGLGVWSLGTGVGSSGFDQPNHIDLSAWKPLLADFQRLGVRGPRSKDMLNAMGLANAEVVGDLALSLTQDHLTALADSPRFALNISVPVGQSYNEGEYIRLQELELVLPKLIHQGWQPVPVAMHPSDVEPIRQLLQRLSMEHLPIPVLSSADDFFELVSPCSFTIAVRLHAAVLSCCVGVPPLMLGYRDKCLDFMESMHLEDWHIGLQTAQPSEISDKVLLLAQAGLPMRSQILNQAKLWKTSIRTYISDLVPLYV